ncbi:MAG TPA: hypothetical protein VFB07_04825 [Vicinamibacterales bacterium]|nr:hypothetical protein [Vicinamibacterales bacterium]
MPRRSAPRRALRASLCLWLALAAGISAHDAERTSVTLTFERDGSFVLDVSNDPNWLKLRMERFGDDFVDRVVLWVDGAEVRPRSAEYLPPRSEDAPATWRLRGRMPSNARTLRWYYGLVGDPYPLTIARADGRRVTETVLGDAWSGPIDLSGQFVPPWRATIERQLPIALLVLLFALALVARVVAARATRPAGGAASEPRSPRTAGS